MDELIEFHRALRGTVPTTDALRATVEWYLDAHLGCADETARGLVWLESLDSCESDALGWQGAARDVDGMPDAHRRRTEGGHVPVWQTFGKSAHEGYEILEGAPVGSPVSLANLLGEAKQRATAAAWERDATRRERGEYLTKSQRKNRGRRARKEG
jgi:hypothetical protein